MIKTKQDYFTRSREQGLPNRCPILSRCSRRFHTIELANKGVSFPESFRPDQPEVPVSGEGPYLIDGNGTRFLISGTCPEVALFEPALFLVGLNHTATIRGQYDKFAHPQYEVLEAGHFSECAEYSIAITDAKIAAESLSQQEITKLILDKLGLILAIVQEAKVNDSARNAAAAIEDAKRTPSPVLIKRAVEIISPLASLVDAGSKLAPHIEVLGRLIGLI